MFNLTGNTRGTKLRVQEVLWENYTDIDIMRQKPMIFRCKEYHIVVEPVLYFDHPLFIKMYGYILSKHAWVFDQVSMLTDNNFRDKESIDEAVASLAVFRVGEEYETFIKDTEDFIIRWALFFKKEEDELIEIEYTEDDSDERKAVLRKFNINELYQILFTLFVFNFDVVKKNLLDCLNLLQGSATKDTNGSGSHKKDFPAFKMSRYNRSRSTVSGKQN